MLSLLTALLMSGPTPAPPPPLGSAAFLASKEAQADENWRQLDLNKVIEMRTESGTVIIELAHKYGGFVSAERIGQLASAGAFDDGTVDRVQENYVVQWSAASPASEWSNLEPEFWWTREHFQQNFVSVPFSDSYAPQVGFSDGFPMARDGEAAWYAHCYGMVGIGRGAEAGDANGTELYVVIGQAPRHLDRNIALVGRVVKGMENLTSLPRGNGELGFYTDAQKKPRILSFRRGGDIPEAERESLEIMRTDTPAFGKWVAARANRATDGWFTYSHGAIDLCNIPVPVREVTDEE
ncbi:MAG: peptidylprolyl isomerase [Pacificimonas sp.]